MADTTVTIKLGLQGAAGVKVGLEQIGAAASLLKSKLLPIGAALAGAAGLGSLAAAAVNTAKLGGELSDLSARTGIGVRALVTLRQAFADAGAGADAVGATINRLQRLILDAAENGGEASRAFTDIGLSAQALSGLAPEDQFRAVSEAISGIENPAQRTAAAMAIFGKSAGELLPLFADGGALANAERVLGKMPEVLARNVGGLDAIADSFDRLPAKATQLFAGIYDQLAPTVQAMLDAFEGIDFTAIGQRIGAFVGVAIDEFKAGRFSEFIGVAIAAGFEYGVERGEILLRGLVDTISTPSFWAGLGNALVTIVNNTLASIARLFAQLQAPVIAFRQFLFESMRWAFLSAVDALLNALGWLQSIPTLISDLMFGTNEFGAGNPTASGTTVFSGSLAGAAPSIADAFKNAEKAASAMSSFADDFFKASTGAYRELTGTGTLSSAGTERARLAAMMEGRLVEREVRAAAEAPTRQVITAEPLRNIRAEMQAAELAYQERILALRNQAGAVESNWLLTNNQKRERTLAILDQEVRAIDEQISRLEELRTIGTPEEQLAIDRQMAGLRGQQGGLRNQMLGAGPDPNSYADQWSAALTRIQNEFLTAAQWMAKSFEDAFTAATGAISNGIQGLIYGTMTWGQALMNIGQSIVQSLVKSFADMVAQWIMSHVIMKSVSTAWAAFTSTMRAKDIAEANATEAAKMPALAANATLASIGSWGIAAVVGVAAIAGILASLGAFREGGYTGDGDRNDVAGIVHRGEFVVPADAVDRIGVGTLEAMTASGTVGPAVVSSTSTASPITLNMGVFDDPRRMGDWARSVEGRAVIIDIVRQSAHEIA